MKSKIVDQVEREVEIDWSKPQLLTYCEDQGTTIIVAYSGSHTDDVFEGKVLYSSIYDVMYFNTSWDKASFKPLQGSVTIEFNND